MTNTTSTLKAPEKLNGYPVIKQQAHDHCVSVMIDTPYDLVCASWWPELGTSWSWGHYAPKDMGDYKRTADDLWGDVVARHSRR